MTSTLVQDTKSLDDWLSYIESQHPADIELGLERGMRVLNKLNIVRPKEKIITVAGTNGKGSTCAMLSQYLQSQDNKVGTYTSPHFIDFNERIVISGAPCDEQLICDAFAAIERCREDIPLTYFEFSTLAALLIFSQSNLDYWVLEVGLGGRLDSVNMIDTDLAVITSIALDHTDWLGDSLDDIAREKAGIARPGKLLISGVVNPPGTIKETAQRIGAPLYQKGQDFSFRRTADTWSWLGNEQAFNDLPLPNLPLENAATVIAVLSYMGMDLSQDGLADLFETTELVGRFQKVSNQPAVYIDVAHNPEAASELANHIKDFDQAPLAVCGMLNDKDITNVMKLLSDKFSAWYCADLAGPRGAKASDLLFKLNCLGKTTDTFGYQSIAQAYQAAHASALQEARPIVVFGSFVTVTDYLKLVRQGSNEQTKGGVC